MSFALHHDMAWLVPRSVAVGKDKEKLVVQPPALPRLPSEKQRQTATQGPADKDQSWWKRKKKLKGAIKETGTSESREETETDVGNESSRADSVGGKGPGTNSLSKKRKSDADAVETEEQEPAAGAGQAGTGGKRQAKKAKKSFIYGNYDHYYGYRFRPEMGEDARLAYFKQSWFEGKECLDIGCNEGYMTVQVAIRFGCKRILGVDIDGSRIGQARKSLRRQAAALWKSNSKQELADISKSHSKQVQQVLDNTAHEATLSNVRVQDGELQEGNVQGTEASTPEAPGEQIRERMDLLEVVKFRKENFVAAQHQPEAYDTIMCLSVTKWIQLNWGDEGVKQLFAKVYSSLKPGGLFLLEPQPWQSYKNNRGVSQVASTNFLRIELRPDKFAAYLESIGFLVLEHMKPTVPASQKGFNRPLWLFKKLPAHADAQSQGSELAKEGTDVRAP